MPKPWPLIGSTVDKSYSAFSVRTDTACCPCTGQEHDFYVLQSPDWVNVIPLTPDEHVVMVRQYRHGTRGIGLEIPGGLAKPGDSVEAAARRELLEETGYEASEFIFLGSARPATRYLHQRVCHLSGAGRAESSGAPFGRNRGYRGSPGVSVRHSRHDPQR